MTSHHVEYRWCVATSDRTLNGSGRCDVHQLFSTPTLDTRNGIDFVWDALKKVIQTELRRSRSIHAEMDQIYVEILKTTPITKQLKEPITGE